MDLEWRLIPRPDQLLRGVQNWLVVNMQRKWTWGRAWTSCPWEYGTADILIRWRILNGPIICVVCRCYIYHSWGPFTTILLYHAYKAIRYLQQQLLQALPHAPIGYIVLCYHPPMLAARLCIRVTWTPPMRTPQSKGRDRMIVLGSIPFPVIIDYVFDNLTCSLMLGQFYRFYVSGAAKLVVASRSAVFSIPPA